MAVKLPPPVWALCLMFLVATVCLPMVAAQRVLPRGGLQGGGTGDAPRQRRAESQDASRPLRPPANLMRRLPPIDLPWTKPTDGTGSSAGRETSQAIYLADPAQERGAFRRAIAESPAGERRDAAVIPTSSAQEEPPDQLGGEARQFGDLVTLHLNEVNVRQALEILSRTHNVSILVSPAVSGTVTANLEGLSVEQALHAILKLCNLVAIRERGLVYVYSQEEYPQGELDVRVFRIDYVAAEDMLPPIQALLSPVGQAFMSQVDVADNRNTVEAVVVTDLPSSMARIENYVRQTDMPPRQVMIEAHVLQINLTDDTRHGVNYDHIFQVAGSTVEIDVAGFADPMASPAVFARINGTEVDGLIEFLKSTTDAKTLASPRVMVINGQKARIQVGEQLGYKVITVTETAAVEEVKFLDVGVVLEVTPRISRENRVLMRVKPEVSDGLINPDTLLPEEETRELESDVLLHDGQGVVIGGLIQEKNNIVQQKLPLLGDLHLVGWLFQRTLNERKRTEVVITLVPRICDDGLPHTERDVMDAMRSQTPLLDGPLIPVPRPWEARLPNSRDNPIRMGHFARLHCYDCNTLPCCCGEASGEMPPPDLEPLEPIGEPMHSFEPTMTFESAQSAEPTRSLVPVQALEPIQGVPPLHLPPEASAREVPTHIPTSYFPPVAPVRFE